ncbi:MAG: hypothetical protein R6W90_16885 [Ignavibacteriaceae bacterium]
MAQKRSNPKERQIGKKQPEKKHLIDPRYKNTVWTTAIIVVLIIFFIINNTREVPEIGPFPPGFNPGNLQEKLNADVPAEIQIKDSSK